MYMANVDEVFYFVVCYSYWVEGRSRQRGTEKSVGERTLLSGTNDAKRNYPFCQALRTSKFYINMLWFIISKKYHVIIP